MSKLSKALHMFVADQWVQGNAGTPKAHWAGCSHWFPGGVTEVRVGDQFRQFQGVSPSQVMGMLKGAGWYGRDAKDAQRALQGSKFEHVEVRPAVSYPNVIFLEGRDHVEFLEYQKGNSPALLLLAAYRALKKRKEAEKTRRPLNWAALMQVPERGHAKSDLSSAQAETVIQRSQKLNTLLLHRDLANALEAVNRVLHWGCNERQPPYPETGWKDVPLDKYKQALLRHQSEWLKDPSSLDDESGKLHLAHMATNALILLQRWPEEGKNGSSNH